VPALLGVRLEVCEQAGQVVGLGGVETRFGATTAVVVLTDEDVGVLEDHFVSGGRPHLEGHIGEQLTLVVAVEVDLEHTADVRLVVRMVVEVHAVDLDRAVVPGRPTSLSARLSGNARDETDGSHQHGDETRDHAPPTAAVQMFHGLDFPSATGLRCPAVPSEDPTHRRPRRRRPMTANLPKIRTGSCQVCRNRTSSLITAVQHRLDRTGRPAILRELQRRVAVLVQRTSGAAVDQPSGGGEGS
jgi:hypothetical protein